MTYIPLLLTLPLIACTHQDLEPRAEASRSAAKAFMQDLKAALQQAMKEGGPVNAIGVCNEKAPAIAAQISEQQGWRVGRTSLRVRNPSNSPDDWERSVLESFERRQRNGEAAKALEHYEIARQNGEPVFRYMKAIPTAEICITCHGETIADEIAAKLKQLYPEDQATGYKPGDIRGAFTISQPL
jgi:hypothetical protein